MAKRIVMLELNEVPWRVLDDFVKENPSSAFAEALPAAAQFTTVAPDSSLSPWITWPTLHRGVSDEAHMISDFGQDLSEVDAQYPPIWSLLRRAGVKTGVCSSLHTYPLPEDVGGYAFFVPDPFASGPECHPKAVEAFQAFNLLMSRESARNVSGSVPIASALRFVAAAPGLGVTAGTLADVVRQLADERRRGWVKARRRTYQPVLAFDIFAKQLRKTRPAFATFFTNHVASAMHRYWAARYPDDYAKVSVTPDWIRTYEGEIPWAMGKADAMLRRLLDHQRETGDCEIWVASSMGQAATDANAVHTQVYLSELDVFMRALGFAPEDWERRPAMLPRVIVKMKAGREAEFAAKLAKVEIVGRGALPWKQLEHGVFRIHPGVIQNVTDEHCLWDGARVPFARLGFRNEPIQDAVGSSAYHVPEGSLFVIGSERRPGPVRPRVSTEAVAPTLLRHFGVSVPTYMKGTPL